MTRKLCPVCHGTGKIRNPKDTGNVIAFDKFIVCPNCNGDGFVGIPDNPIFKKSFYKFKEKNEKM
jgi:DnaJ-class molecular chaperone